jgi:acyl-CoA reductase-like NAD-dependent aldehyde dehydrogenase
MAGPPSFPRDAVWKVVYQVADRNAAIGNSGQTCVTANRIYVQEGIYDKFVAALTERIKTLKVGCGWEKDVFIGPLTHERAVEKAMAHIDGLWRLYLLSLLLHPLLKE